MKLSKKFAVTAIAGLIAGLPGGSLAANPAGTTAATTKAPPASAAASQYIDKVKALIEHNWFPASDPKGHVVVFFRVAKDGRVYWMELDDVSGTPSVNHSAEDAILAVGKLPPLPAGMDTLDLSVEFKSAIPESAVVYYSRPTPERVKASKVLAIEAEAEIRAKSMRAVEMLEQAYEMTPFRVEVRDRLIDAYISSAEAAKPESVAGILHSAFLIDPRNAKIAAKLKSYWKSQGKDLGDYSTVVQMAEDYAKAAKPIDALAQYCQAWLLKQDSALIPEINKTCLQREGFKSVQKWLSICERDRSADNLAALAKAYESYGDMELARRMYKKTLKADPSNESARKFLQAQSQAQAVVATASGANEEEEEEEEEEGTKETRTVSLVAPAPVGLCDSFPLASPGQRSVKISVLKNRRNVQDYYEHTCMGHEVHRWTPGRFPLRLYVNNGRGVPGYRPQFNQMAINAFAAWAKGSEQRLSYVVVNDPRGANVTVDWTADAGKLSIPNAQGQTFFQFMKSGTGNNTIKGAKITIMTVWRHDKSVMIDKAMNMVVLHEIGHALGLSGHSPNRADVMFYAISPRGPFLPELSAGDNATIKHMYQGYEHPAPTTVDHVVPSQ